MEVLPDHYKTFKIQHDTLTMYHSNNKKYIFENDVLQQVVEYSDFPFYAGYSDAEGRTLTTHYQDLRTYQIGDKYICFAFENLYELTPNFPKIIFKQQKITSKSAYFQHMLYTYAYVVIQGTVLINNVSYLSYLMQKSNKSFSLLNNESKLYDAPFIKLQQKMIIINIDNYLIGIDEENTYLLNFENISLTQEKIASLTSSADSCFDIDISTEVQQSSLLLLVQENERKSKNKQFNEQSPLQQQQHINKMLQLSLNDLMEYPPTQQSTNSLLLSSAQLNQIMQKNNFRVKIAFPLYSFQYIQSSYNSQATIITQADQKFICYDLKNYLVYQLNSQQKQVKQLHQQLNIQPLEDINQSYIYFQDDSLFQQIVSNNFDRMQLFFNVSQFYTQNSIKTIQAVIQQNLDFIIEYKLDYLFQSVSTYFNILERSHQVTFLQNLLQEVTILQLNNFKQHILKLYFQTDTMLVNQLISVLNQVQDVQVNHFFIKQLIVEISKCQHITNQLDMFSLQQLITTTFKRLNGTQKCSLIQQVLFSEQLLYLFVQCYENTYGYTTGQHTVYYYVQEGYGVSLLQLIIMNYNSIQANQFQKIVLIKKFLHQIEQQTTPHQETCLMIVCKYCVYDILNIFINTNADSTKPVSQQIFLCDVNKKTALHYLAMNLHSSIINTNQKFLIIQLINQLKCLKDNSNKMASDYLQEQFSKKQLNNQVLYQELREILIYLINQEIFNKAITVEYFNLFYQFIDMKILVGKINQQKSCLFLSYNSNRNQLQFNQQNKKNDKLMHIIDVILQLNNMGFGLQYNVVFNEVNLIKLIKNKIRANYIPELENVSGVAQMFSLEEINNYFPTILNHITVASQQIVELNLYKNMKQTIQILQEKHHKQLGCTFLQYYLNNIVRQDKFINTLQQQKSSNQYIDRQQHHFNNFSLTGFLYNDNLEQMNSKYIEKIKHIIQQQHQNKKNHCVSSDYFQRQIGYMNTNYQSENMPDIFNKNKSHYTELFKLTQKKYNTEFSSCIFQSSSGGDEEQLQFNFQ